MPNLDAALGVAGSVSLGHAPALMSVSSSSSNMHSIRAGVALSDECVRSIVAAAVVTCIAVAVAMNVLANMLCYSVIVAVAIINNTTTGAASSSAISSSSVGPSRVVATRCGPIKPQSSRCISLLTRGLSLCRAISSRAAAVCLALVVLSILQHNDSYY